MERIRSPCRAQIHWDSYTRLPPPPLARSSFESCFLNACRLKELGVAGCMGDVKILIAGSVHGKLKDLFKRVAAVNKSNGPFDLLLCTGDFFGGWKAGNKALMMHNTSSASVT